MDARAGLAMRKLSWYFLGDKGNVIISCEWGFFDNLDFCFQSPSFVWALSGHKSRATRPTCPVPVTTLGHMWSSTGCKHSIRWLAQEKSRGLILQPYYEALNTNWFLFFQTEVPTFFDFSSQKQSDPEFVSLEKQPSPFSKWTKCVRRILGDTQPAKPHKTGPLLLVAF